MHCADRRFKLRERQGKPHAPGISLLRVVIPVLVLIFILGGWVITAEAQTAATLAVSSPQTLYFPEISVEFKLTDSAGHPIRNLDPSQLTVVEDGVELPVSSVAEIYRGIHFVLAVNGDREMDLRDAGGISRYQRISDSLQGWASGWRFKGDDSWSLMTNSGLEVEDAADAVSWMTGLDAYQPNFRQLEPELTSLQEAIQMLQRDEVSFGVDKAILYLTPPPKPDQIAGVNALAGQARQAGIQVNVWMVGEAYYLTNDQGGSLIEMAAGTGGNFFHYTGSETFPDLDGILYDLGYAAELVYQSALRETGSYPLAVRAELAELEVSGESLPFYVDIQAPNPMLLAPPVSIPREAVKDDGADTISFTPAQVELQILVEYPDGHPRDLTASRLLVDGSVMDVNTSAPFDQFTWDLTDLTEPGEHTIQVEIEDELGFVASTLLTPVQIEIIESGNSGRLSFQEVGLIVSGVVAGTGMVILGVWLFRRFWRDNQPRWQRKRPETGTDKEAEITGDGIRDNRTFAILLPIDSFDVPGKDTGLVVDKLRTTIGRDPQQADLVIDSSSVSPVQAELSLEEDGFWIRHIGTHGRTTWLNYQPVGPDRVQVKPGDLLHFGDSGFRFTMGVEGPEGKISISRYEPFK